MRYRAVSLLLLGTVIASAVLLVKWHGVVGSVRTLSGIAVPTARAQTSMRQGRFF